MTPDDRAGWNPQAYGTCGAFVSAYGTLLLDKLAPQVGEDILDLGCGDGRLSLEIMASGARVQAIDADQAMVAAARANGVDAHLLDARQASFDAQFDAIFTNAALHWIRPPQTVAAAMFKALRPGGRYVGEFGGHGNIAAIRTALRAVLARRGVPLLADEMNYYPTAEAYCALLESVGFVVTHSALTPRPTPLACGMTGWLETFRGPLLAACAATSADKAALCDEICDLLRPILCDDQGGWMADYVRLSFVAHRPDAPTGVDSAPLRTS